MAAVKADPAAGKADLVGAVRRVVRVVQEKVRGMGVVGRVGRGIHPGVDAVTRLPSSRSRL